MRPRVLVFDVNETLLDIESITPLFADLFGDGAVMREWFGQLIVYSMTAALSRRYVDFFSIGRAALRMVADIHHRPVTDADVEHLATGLRTMPAHPDVVPGLAALRSAGYGLVTLTNSPPSRPNPLDHAGIAELFDRHFSVDECHTFKPDGVVYRHVCDELGIAPADAMMVAAHVWDTVGAQSAGMTGALLTRPGNAPLPVDGLPQPDLVAADMRDLAHRLNRTE